MRFDFETKEFIASLWGRQSHDNGLSARYVAVSTETTQGLRLG
jgi:hypothetical protein